MIYIKKEENYNIKNEQKIGTPVLVRPGKIYPCNFTWAEIIYLPRIYILNTKSYSALYHWKFSFH